RRCIQPRPVTPLAVELDAVWRVGDHQRRLPFSQESCHGFRVGGIGTEDAMLTTPIATEPKVARARHRVVWDWRDGIGSIVVGGEQEVIDFFRVETGEAEIELRRGELLQLESEKLFVPRRPGCGPIHQQAEGFHLRFGPLVAEDHRDRTRVAAGPRSQLPRSLQAEVAVYNFTVAARQDGDLEAELPNARAHFIDDSVILPRVPSVEDELIDWPDLNLC